jgi:hypothetical protein
VEFTAIEDHHDEFDEMDEEDHEEMEDSEDASFGQKQTRSVDNYLSLVLLNLQ